MMFTVLLILCCTYTVSATDSDTSNREPAPPFDLLEKAFKVLEREAGGCMLEEMRNTLDNIAARLGDLEGKVDSKFDELEGKIASKFGELEGKVDTIKIRQQTWLSEVRLISLFKLTGENNKYGDDTSHNPGLVVDGQYVFSERHDIYMRTYSYTNSATNNQIWIDLGGLFRVYSVRVWNVRHSSSRSGFRGTEIYVGDGTRIGELIGTASGVHEFYDFTLSKDDVKYGSRVTLKQPRNTRMIVLEVQVWGNGPYDSSDKFN